MGVEGRRWTQICDKDVPLAADHINGVCPLSVTQSTEAGKRDTHSCATSMLPAQTAQWSTVPPRESRCDHTLLSTRAASLQASANPGSKIDGRAGSFGGGEAENRGACRKAAGLRTSIARGGLDCHREDGADARTEMRLHCP